MHTASCCNWHSNNSTTFYTDPVIESFQLTVTDQLAQSTAGGNRSGEGEAPGVPRESPQGIWRRWIERYGSDRTVRIERNGEVERATLPSSWAVITTQQSCLHSEADYHIPLEFDIEQIAVFVVY